MIDKLTGLLILSIDVSIIILMLYAYDDVLKFKHTENEMRIKLDQTISSPDGTCNIIQKD